MTPLQTKIIHIAKKQANVTDEEYRAILRDTAGVDSSKHLDNDGFENVMAVLEGRGFRESDKPGDYWRRRVNLKGEHIDSRTAFVLREMSAKSVYELGALCWRHSHHRTREVDKLYPREAWELIEMLKASNERSVVRDQKSEAAEPQAVTSSEYPPVTEDEVPF